MRKKVRYIEEIYREEYGVFYQAIFINNDLDKKTNGRHSKEIRSTVNPNLNILHKRKFYDDNFNLIREDRLESKNIFLKKGNLEKIKKLAEELAEQSIRGLDATSTFYELVKFYQKLMEDNSKEEQN